jgi:hypothetical protein
LEISGLKSVIAIAATAIALPAFAQVCTPLWSDQFAPGSFDGSIASFAVFDEGAGPMLFAGGRFDRAGRVDEIHNIARWNGTSWTAVGAGLNRQVSSLAVLDYGTGPALYATGAFPQGVVSSPLERWNGSTWSAFPSTGGPSSATSAVVWDSGAGSSLYIAGDLGFPNYGVFRWTGSAWVRIGGNFTHPNQGGKVNTLSVFDDGSGSALYAGGLFSNNDATLVRRIAKWNGSSWGPVGQGLGNGVIDDAVQTLAVLDTDGAGPLGPRLVAAGHFASAGGLTATGIAVWDGASWAPLGTLTGASFRTAGIATISGTTAVYAGAYSSATSQQTKTYRWTGIAWTPVDALASSGGVAFAEFGDGAERRLISAGIFSDTSGNSLFRSAAAWNGAAWTSVGSNDLGTGLSGVGVNYAAILDADGTGPSPARLFLSGFISDAAGLRVSGLASWDGHTWSRADGGISASTQASVPLVVFDDGDGPRLFAVGFHQLSSGASTYFSRWNGTSWVDLGSGLSGTAYCAASLNDGTGEALYIGGYNLTAPGMPSTALIRWKNGVWSLVGGAVGSDYVFALAQFDDGSGSAI